MKKTIALATLLQLTAANASIVAIMDSGTDISHNYLKNNVWVNKNEKEGSKEDLDGSGLPGDVNGWDFTENSPKVFNNKYDYLIDADVKKFYSLYAKYETKTITMPEFEWLKNAVSNSAFSNKVNFVGGYAHGTHVGGIAVAGNKDAKLLSLKILPTVYQDPEQALAQVQKEPVQLELDFTPAASVESFKRKLVEMALGQIEEMKGMNGYVGFHKADVVNQSFGIGFMQAAEFIHSGFIGEVKRAPTQDELVEMIVTYFGVMRTFGPAMFDVAPNTLFVVASGNDGSNNDQLPDYPSDIPAANKLVVAATFGYSELAEFSNYGATKVDLAAPGVAIDSTSPAQAYLQMSGTSQAAPFVTNILAKAKDINPKLTASELKAIVLETVDVKPWLKGKVATSGIANRGRALRAAEFSKSLSLDKAIAKAKEEVRDVAVTKSFAKRLPGMKLNFAPLRPSLLVKLPSDN